MKWLQGPWPVMFSNYGPSPTHKYHHRISHAVFVILSVSQQGTCVCGNDEKESKRCLAIADYPVLQWSFIRI